MFDILPKVLEICREKNATLLYLARVGSHAFGTSTMDSDEDFRGVILPPIENLLGLHKLDNICIKADDDLVLKSIGEYLKLCLQGNPNIVDWIFVDIADVVYVEEAFSDHILSNRKEFLSKQLYHRFKGYIYGHLQKMQRGVTRDLGAARKLDIERHGYSCKNAMHMIRLGRTALDVLQTGKYNVWRPDAEELLHIRYGDWSKENVVDEIERLLVEMERAVDSDDCPLPKNPNRKFMENEMLEVMFKVLPMRRE